VRLPAEARDMVKPLAVTLDWDQPDAPARLLGPLLDPLLDDGEA